MKPSPEQTNNRILLIDDNPAIHEDFRKVLALRTERAVALDRTEAALRGELPLRSASGVFEIDSAFQGEEGLQKARAARTSGRPYAVAFVDVRMPPGWDGIETVAHLWQACPDLQVVICTAHADYSWHEITNRLTQLDSLLILKKPFDNIEVLQMANALTRKWSLSHQLSRTFENLESLVDARTRNLEMAHEQLRQAQKMEAIGQLAAGVAHDFNNILTVIQAHAGLHLDSCNLDKDVAESLREMAAAATRAANLTRQLLAFSRKQVIRPEALDLEAAIVSVGTLLRRVLGEQIVLQLECDSSLPPILADVCSVEQILLNLAVNARDAMPQGGLLIIRTERVRITEADRTLNAEALCGEFACLSVIDTGSGIDESIKSKIFEPFFTTKDVGKGTGMGLATVHGIVKQHRGWIEVESALGKGSRFKVFFPFASETAGNG